MKLGGRIGLGFTIMLMAALSFAQTATPTPTSTPTPTPTPEIAAGEDASFSCLNVSTPTDCRNVITINWPRVFVTLSPSSALTDLTAYIRIHSTSRAKAVKFPDVDGIAGDVQAPISVNKGRPRVIVVPGPVYSVGCSTVTVTVGNLDCQITGEPTR